MAKGTIGAASDWDKYNHLFKRQEVPAKTILLREGEISKNAYLIEKGCLRTWFNNDGSDITTQFFFEGDGVSSVESFRTNEPSLYSIESIEPCIIKILSKKDFEFVLDNSPGIKMEMERHLFRRFIDCQKLLLSHIKDSPQQRYEQILQQRPDIIMRVPQHYIASYLGITKVHLSRIKSKLAGKR
ncbi:Crp/Fnr family transcriptional regulator [Chitinophaga filiformis]|uniref:Crp/Fnr family transcriptional regulator n=1 Tax=Chitinophaga filiformis TaxID=104663 RepID=UPI001F1C6C92|nr:Crp/Fnr family transcriptional regulator [Chitinophaga filiformis]MCF6404320.1 Crp/Fnr family transcriptional regulator [Chitinophaga filiformis]